ncbi:hypothetical protein CN316_30045 [Bacillus cereus]|nr:hypothetical protein CN316_30045 [Bacillus cereus]
MTLLLGMSVLQWVPLASAIISFCAVVVAMSALGFQYWQFKKNREPVIGPAIKKFNVELPEAHLDWETGDEIDGQFSRTTIPLYNYGGTTAINIEYSYSCTNIKEMGKMINGNFKTKYRNIVINSVNEEVGTFNVLVENPKGVRIIEETRRYIERRDLIKSNDKVEILLPSYFIMIIAHIAQIKQIDNKGILPILELCVTYNDVNHKSYKVKYIIKIGLFRQNIKTAPDKPKLEFECIPEFISKVKLK